MENVIIADKEKLSRTVKEMKKQGISHLHVVSDFDRTLTKYSKDGKKIPSIIALIREGGYLGENYVKEAHRLHGIYYPIEIDPKIPFKEKNKKMMEWWKLHFNLLIESGYNKKITEEIVKKRELPFRNKAFDFLFLLNQKKVPLIIMTATLNDILEEILKYENHFYPNIHLIGNRFVYDKYGVAIKIKKPIIHSLNKHEIEIKNLIVYKELLKRKNIILMGDLIEDINMIQGFPYSNLIKIGFLNEEKNLEEYKKNFDVIIANDSGIEYLINLIKEIDG